MRRFLCVLDCNLLAIFDGWFSPSCVHSEAPLDLLLLNIGAVSCGVATIWLGDFFSPPKYTSFLHVLIRLRCSLRSCEERSHNCSQLSWHSTSMSDLKSALRYLRRFCFGSLCTACDGWVFYQMLPSEGKKRTIVWHLVDGETRVCEEILPISI